MKPALTFELGTPLNTFPHKAETKHLGNYENLRAVYLWVFDYINNPFCKKKKNVPKLFKGSSVSM